MLSNTFYFLLNEENGYITGPRSLRYEKTSLGLECFDQTARADLRNHCTSFQLPSDATPTDLSYVQIEQRSIEEDIG